MEKDTLQQNFEGYLNTFILWHKADVYNIQQFDLEPNYALKFDEKVQEQLRLGKLVERFVFHELNANDDFDIVAENIQIRDGKRTVGEMDALLMTKNGPLHLEIIYKFYLFDPSGGACELSHWIGPNRKDSLVQKLDKLKKKQLPLLYHSKTQIVLNNLKLNLSEIKQQVLFKAQLFLPFDYNEFPFGTLNPSCLKGFYLKLEKLHHIEHAQFYIPPKGDWLMDCNADVDWMDFSDFQVEVSHWTHKKRSPLCWLHQKGKFSKFFVVWW